MRLEVEKSLTRTDAVAVWSRREGATLVEHDHGAHEFNPSHRFEPLVDLGQ